MKDADGSNLEVGDEVMFCPPNYNRLTKGTVEQLIAPFGDTSYGPVLIRYVPNWIIPASVATGFFAKVQSFDVCKVVQQ